MHCIHFYSFNVLKVFRELFWVVLRLKINSCSTSLQRDRGHSCLCPTEQGKNQQTLCRHKTCPAKGLKAFPLTWVRSRARKSHDCFYQPQNILPEVEGIMQQRISFSKSTDMTQKFSRHYVFFPRSILNTDTEPLPSTRFNSALWKPRGDGAAGMGWQLGRAETPICPSLPWLPFSIPLQKSLKDL